MWIEAGNMSLDDIGWLTSSLGWTERPSRSDASVASTSFMFILLLVPEPVWNTSIGNWSSWSPRATASAATMIASARSPSISPRSRLTDATAALMRASASIWARSSRTPEIGKFSTARWVWARHFAEVGTCTSPIESRSTRDSLSAVIG